MSLKLRRGHSSSQEGYDFVTKRFSKELVLKVFSFLSLRDLMQCSLVSIHWSIMANDEMLWKPLFIKRFLPEIETHRQRIKRKRKWKLKYKIHHNWLRGNCHVFEITNVFENHSFEEKVKYHLQFQNDFVYLANTCASIIDIWQYQPKTKSLILYEQLQSIELKSHPNVNVSFLKLIDQYLIAGYSNGGFTLWEIDINTEIASYFPSITQSDSVLAINMNYPVLALYTEHMKLSIFHLRPTLKMIHCLESPVYGSPLIIDIKDFHRGWKITVCFGLSNGSIGMQEIVTSLDSILSSRQGYVIQPFVSSSIIPSSVNYRTSTSNEITSIVYSPPYLITSHKNNTIKQYVVYHDLSIVLKRTWYDHTFKVDILSTNKNKKKLISGDKSSIKIWDIKNGICQVSLYNYQNQSHMNELPNVTIETLEFDEENILAIMYSKSSGYSLRLWTFNL